MVFLATLSLFGSTQALPGYNLNEIYRLVGMIEPSTCGCAIAQACQIKIPYTVFLGINCNSGTEVSL